MSLFDMLELREYLRAASTMPEIAKNIKVAEDFDKSNYVIRDKKAYTEDNVLVYNIFVYSIPRQFTEDNVRRHFAKFGEVSKVRVVPDKKKSRRAAPKVAFINFVDPMSAARALMKINHRLQGARIGIKAADSWNQPNAEKAVGYRHENVSNENEEKACSSKKANNKNSRGGLKTTTTTTNQASTKTDTATTTTITTTDTATTATQSASSEAEPISTMPEDAAENAAILPMSSNALNILSLNDDCLDMICGTLELRDQIHFARVCQRFYDIFKIYCKIEYKNFDMYKMSQMTLWEIRDFFRFAGEYIEKLTGCIPYKHRDRIAEFIRIYCVNMKRMALEDSKMRAESLKKLLNEFTTITDLRLHDCSLNDYAVKALLPLKNLETLSLSENYEVTGRYISGLKQLKTLNLYGCGNIQTTYLIEICKKMKQLQTLDIRRCERLTLPFYEALVKHCQQLEILKLSCPEFSYESIARLPRLKQLELLHTSSHYTTPTTLLKELVAHKCEQLESLKIVARNSLISEHFTYISQLKHLKIFFCASNKSIGDESLHKLCQLNLLEELVIKGCDEITNDGLLKLLKSCTRLHHLNVQFCKNITRKFISDAIDVLRKRGYTVGKQLVVYAYGTAIEDYELNECPIYQAAMKDGLIKVAFHALNFDFNMGEEIDLYDIWDDDDDDFNDEFDDTDDDDDYYNNYDDYDGFYLPGSDMDEDDINFAYDMLGEMYPPNFDILF